MKKLLLGLIAITLLSFSWLDLNSQARIQIIHNSADAAAAVVDVWVNDVLFEDDLQFRHATAFRDAPAGTPLTVEIKGSDSDVNSPAVATFNLTLEDNETYVVVANGIVSPTGYSPATPFDLYIYNLGQETAQNPTETDVLIFHGATDAPTVDVNEVTAASDEALIADNLSYGEFTGYVNPETNDYSLQIRNGENTVAVAQFSAPLATLNLQGAAIVVVASGFLNPSQNSNGPAFGLFAAAPTGGALIALPTQTFTPARVQLIHNSADAAAATVDVWVNNAKVAENFSFRNATPFIDLEIPAFGETLTVFITAPGSTSPTPAVASFPFTPVSTSYIVIANGIASPTGYNPNPAVNLDVFRGALETNEDSNQNTKVLVYHGSTDAPTVDVFAQGVGTLVDNISYSEFQGYLDIPASQDYVLTIQDETGNVDVASFIAPLNGLDLGGSAITVLASGFLNPSNNSNGAAFGLYVATKDGGPLTQLPAPAADPTALVQVIHNSADAAADTVDIYLNGEILLDNFAFRNASPFVPVPAEEAITIEIKGKDSEASTPAIATYNYTLDADAQYIIVANGIVSADGYLPATPFNLHVYATARTTANNEENTDVLVFHGSTDAPTVDVFAQGVGTLVNDLAYSEFDGYLEVPANQDYILTIQDETGTVDVASYTAPLSALAGRAITVLASGFLDPSNNSNGPAFGLYVALAEGGELIELPLFVDLGETALVQIIHNSADAAADTVDIYLNGKLLLDNFAFRNVTPFVPVPAEEEITIQIKGKDSDVETPAIATYNYTLDVDGQYIIIANGIVSATGYEPATPFNLYVNAMARTEANEAGNTDVLVFHGATDAPTVDIFEASVIPVNIINDLSYGEFSDYLELPTLNYTIQVRDETGETVVASYAAPLATLGLTDAAITVLASGFLNPAMNSNGPAFGLFVAVEGESSLVPLPIITSTSDKNKVEFNIYPNPSQDISYIELNLERSLEVTIRLTDLQGKIISNNYKGIQAAGFNRYEINTNAMEAGIYFIEMITGDKSSVRKLVIAK